MRRLRARERRAGRGRGGGGGARVKRAVGRGASMLGWGRVGEVGVAEGKDRLRKAVSWLEGREMKGWDKANTTALQESGGVSKEGGGGVLKKKEVVP